MARKSSRRSAPQVSAPLSSSRSTVAPARATMRVAVANRVVADALPSVIYQERKPPLRAASPSPKSAPLASVSQSPRTISPSDRPAREARSLDTFRDLSCKGRPTTSKGSGVSRPFVPWCKK